MDIRFVDVKAGKSHVRRLPCVVGRGDDADFRIKNDSVSRRHCRFTLDDGVVHVTDLGSTNGTAVDRKSLAADAATPISTGAQVRLGGILLRVEYTVQAPAAAGARDDDTVPLADAALPDVNPAVDAPAGHGSVETAAADVAPEPEPASATGFAALGHEDAAPQPADGSFDFLGGAAAEPPAADDKLDDFFKKLS